MLHHVPGSLLAVRYASDAAVGSDSDKYDPIIHVFGIWIVVVPGI